ncbi:basic proline-rich protein-like [Panthera tigris]|uniref:basic proline-rich protein-like n=1 Tax=Panthera tigris TaxID=9694 RepID=UPI001C6F717A|nr:basic proline-rich protein-like [Panthera tigris]
MSPVRLRAFLCPEARAAPRRAAPQGLALRVPGACLADRPPPAPTGWTLALTLTLTTGGDRQRRRPAPLGKPSVDHPPAGPTQSTRPAGSTRKTLRAGRPRTRTPAASGHVPSARRPARRPPLPAPGGPGQEGPGGAQKVGRLRWPGIEPGSTAWKAAMLTTIPPTLHGPGRPDAAGPGCAPAPWRLGALSPPPPPPPPPPPSPGAALPRRPGRPQLCPATTGSGHHGLRPPGAPASPLRLRCAGRSPGTPARPPAHLPALRPAPGARRPPPPASGGRSGRLAALGPSEAGWGAPPRPRPGVFRVLRGPQSRGGGRQASHTTSRIHTGPDPSASHPTHTHGGWAAARLRGCAAGRHVAQELAVAAAGTARGPGCAVATQRPASSHAKGWARWTVGRPGTRRRPDDGRPRGSAPAPPSGARGGTQSCAGHQKGRLASPSGNRTPVSRVTGGDTHHYTNEDGGGRPPGRPPDPSPAASPRLPLPALDALPCTGARPGPRPTRPHPRFGPLSRTAAPGPDSESTRTRAHTRTRTALSTPNERCLSLVCQAGIAPGEKAPDGKRGCEGQGQGQGFADFAPAAFWRLFGPPSRLFPPLPSSPRHSRTSPGCKAPRASRSHLWPLDSAWLFLTASRPLPPPPPGTRTHPTVTPCFSPRPQSILSTPSRGGPHDPPPGGFPLATPTCLPVCLPGAIQPSRLPAGRRRGPLPSVGLAHESKPGRWLQGAEALDPPGPSSRAPQRISWLGEAAGRPLRPSVPPGSKIALLAPNLSRWLRLFGVRALARLGPAPGCLWRHGQAVAVALDEGQSTG